MNEPKTILVVDDDAAMLKALTHALQTAGYAVTAHRSAMDAIADMKTPDRRFDLVITDVSMPGMNGITFLIAFKTAFPKIPVILITAFGDWGQYAKAMSEGAFEFLTKPVDKADLLVSVHRALNSKSPQPATPPWDSF